MQSPIDSHRRNRAQKVIFEKPYEEMIMPIRLLYVRAHFNGKLVTNALVESTVNVMPLRMLKALGRNIDGLIEI